MRPLLVFLALGGVLAMLASIAVGAMVSIGSGRPSWLLIGVFVLDSLLLLWLFALLGRRGNNDASN